MYKIKTAVVYQHQQRPLIRVNPSSSNCLGDNNNNNKGKSYSNSSSSSSAKRTDADSGVATASSSSSAAVRDKSNKQESRSTSTTAHSYGKNRSEDGKKYHRQRSSSNRSVMANRRGAEGDSSISNKMNGKTETKEKSIYNNIIKSGRTQGQGSTTSAAPHRSKQALELICLSDSEEILSNPKPAGGSLAVLEDSLEPPKTPPAKDLISYYTRQGLSLSHVRKLNRNYVRFDGPSSEARGFVYWDSYSPPPGFTAEDVPLNDSQSQPLEEVISPAILNAAKYKYKPKHRYAKFADEAELQALMAKLTKRKATDKENENDIERPKKKSTPDYEAPSPCAEPLNTTFPADDLNDSELLMFTQAAELEYNFIEGPGTKLPETSDENSNERKSKNEFQRGGPINTSTPLEKPLALITIRNIGIETPKSAKSIGRNLRTNLMKESFDLFEDSSELPNNNSYTSSRTRGTNMPRKSLFSESKSSGSPITSGDFADDEDDLIFSQMILPEGGNKYSKTERHIERDVAEQSTQIINQTDSFLMHSDFLTEIDRLEEMAICSIENGCKNLGGRPNAVISLADDVKRGLSNAPAISSSKTANCDSPGTVTRVLRGLGRNSTNKK